MKFKIKSAQKENTYIIIRKIGYRFLKKEENGEINCIRPLGSSGYPRFHLYLKIEKNYLVFNLHLDQKRPIYKGSLAHSGEYEGEVVEKELQRIKESLKR